MRHNNRSALGRKPDCQVPLFANRMVWIRKSPRQRVAEHRSALAKLDAVLADVAPLFLGIPLEFHFHAGTLHRYAAILNLFPDIAVGTPLSGRPPHRSRRAVFPHRAPRFERSLLPHQEDTTWSAIAAFQCPFLYSLCWSSGRRINTAYHIRLRPGRQRVHRADPFAVPAGYGAHVRGSPALRLL